ncbi:DUF2020 domain-containing protein [Pseudonocardiaceae bacterium YIM PH 21723]|nr:DUF2020 domain-containing protein [Pseudonocardiaceae bacterium YIM PH 21723]
MRRITVLALLLLVSSCSSGGSPETTTGNPVPGPTTTTQAAIPVDAEPGDKGTCPYLAVPDVQVINGQKVLFTKVTPGQPQPSCFFYGLDSLEQLRTYIYVGDPRVAKALVDRSAPVSTSNPANEPTGWEGGSQATDKGAVYAVAKGGTAVRVVTNQKQTIKAKRISEAIIKNLGL